MLGGQPRGLPAAGRRADRRPTMSCGQRHAHGTGPFAAHRVSGVLCARNSGRRPGETQTPRQCPHWSCGRRRLASKSPGIHLFGKGPLVTSVEYFFRAALCVRQSKTLAVGWLVRWSVRQTALGTHAACRATREAGETAAAAGGADGIPAPRQPVLQGTQGRTVGVWRVVAPVLGEGTVVPTGGFTVGSAAAGRRAEK